MTTRSISPRSFFDARARRYDARFSPSARATAAHLAPLLASGVGARRGGVALDLGCGTGRAWPVLLDAGLDVIALDASSPMLRAAEARASCAGVLRVRADLYAAGGWPIADGACDVVLALHAVFAHPPEAESGGDWRARMATIGREITRVSRSGAYVVIDLPEPSWAAEALTPLGDDRFAWLAEGDAEDDDDGDAAGALVALVPDPRAVIAALGLPLTLIEGEVGARAVGRLP